MRKLLLSSALVIFGITGAVAQVEYPATFTEGGITYTVLSKTAADATITGFDAATLPADLTISTTVDLDGKTRTVKLNPVDGKSIFADANIKSLTINGTPNFGSFAFKGITSLEKLRFENFTNTTIGFEWFSGCTNLSDVVLPNSITSIGQKCFAGTAITSIAIPAGVTKLSSPEFENCTKLESITFAENAQLTELSLKQIPVKSIVVPASVTTLYLRQLQQLESVNFLAEKVPDNFLKPFCFDGCTSVKTIDLPEGLKTIPTYALSGCTALESVTIPSTVTTISANAFNGCSALATINSNPENWTSIENSAFKGCSAFTDTFDLSNVTSIGNSAFLNCGITGVTLGEKLTKMDISAFQNSGLTSVALPASLKNMGTSVFNGCANLKTVTFPETAGLSSIPTNTFSNSGVTELLYPDYVTSIGSSSYSANSNCKNLKKIKFPANPAFTTVLSNATSSCGNVEEVILPDNITTIEKSAFASNKIKEITLPANIESIGESAFENNLIESVEWPENITTIPAYVFRNNQITDISIPATVTEIGQLAFSNNPLNSITLNEGLETISGSAFSSSYATYESIVIPASVMKIGSYAFAYNNNFKYLTLKADRDSEVVKDFAGTYAFGTSNTLEKVVSYNNVPPTLLNNSFSENTYNKAKLDMPFLSKEAYEKATGWEKFKNKNQLSGVEGIEADAADAPAEYFNLQGVRVENPENGIFIRRQGKKVSKVIL